MFLQVSSVAVSVARRSMKLPGGGGGGRQAAPPSNAMILCEKTCEKRIKYNRMDREIFITNIPPRMPLVANVIATVLC